MKTCLKLVVAGVVLYSATAMAAPATMEEMKSTIDALQVKLKAQQSRLDQLETKVSQDMKLEMAKIAKELAADADKQAPGPAWLENLTFSGDFRLRYRGECGDDADAGSADARKKKNRNRAQFRLRFGFIKTWLDEQLTVGFRLASGEADSPLQDPTDTRPTYTDQTFTGLFSRKSIWIDRAYAIYKPKAIPGLVVAGGKVGIPFVHTDLIWDEDVGAEGFWAQYSKAFGPIEPFINAGYFVAYERGPYLDDQYDTILMFYQLGMNWQLCKELKWTFAASYYDYDHTNLATGAESLGFQMINLTNKFAFSAFNLPWEVYFDYVRNCDNRLTVANDGNADEGLAVGVKVGKNAKKGDWSAAYKYAYIEQYCTVPNWNDFDFGGTNVRGHVIRATYNLTDFLTLGGSVFITQTVGDTSSNESLSGVEQVTSIVDLTWDF